MLAALAWAGLVAALLVVLPAQAASAAPEPLRWTQPGNHSWQVPEGVREVRVEVAGGRGGNERYHDGFNWIGHPGGNGAVLTGTLSVTPGETLSLRVASRGGDGATGGGSNSYGRGGTGWRSGGDGGTGSSSGVGSQGQGGGGGGGASAIVRGSSAQLVAAGGGGAGGAGYCGGNPGGHAGGAGWKEPKNCRTDGGDPGQPGTEAGGHGGKGDNAGSSSGQGGGGGGGGGLRGGGGADASTDGGGGGGGGTSDCGTVTGCQSRAGNDGHGYVVLTPVYDTRITLDEDAYAGVSGQQLTISGTVAYAGASPDGHPEGRVLLSAVADEPVAIANVEVDPADGSFSYSCAAPCGAPESAESLRAVYQPTSDVWNPAETSASLHIEAGVTRTDLQVDPRAAVTGQERELTATVSVVAPAQGVPTGRVEFWASPAPGGEDVSLGTADLGSDNRARLEAVSPLMGEHRVWAVYSGDAGFSGSTSPRQTLVTAPAATRTTAVAEPEPSVYGQDYRVLVDVAALAPGAGPVDGEVDVDGETAPLVDGRAEVTIAGGDAGTAGLAVRYLGSERYLPSETAVEHRIDPAETAVTLSQDTETSRYGEPVLLTIEAEPVAPGAGPVSGPFEVWVDGAPSATGTLHDSSAVVELEQLGVGAHVIEARYLGSPNTRPAVSARLDHRVTPADAEVVLVARRAEVTVGTDVLVDVRVMADTDPNAEVVGEVEVRAGDADGDVLAVSALDGGAAKIALEGVEVGDHALVAVYTGSDDVNAGSSEAVAVAVLPADSSTELDVEPQVVAGDQVAVSATVYTAESERVAEGDDAFALLNITEVLSDGAWRAFAPGGEVQFLVDGEPVGQPVVLAPAEDVGPEAATATTTVAFDPGEHRVEARYLGEPRVVGSTSEAVTVTAGESVGDGSEGAEGTGSPVDGSSGPVSSGKLPSTGASDVLVPVALGVMLLLGGALVAGRRRRA